MTELYKVVYADGRAHHSWFRWSLPRDGQPGDWHEVEGGLDALRDARGQVLPGDVGQRKV